MGIIWTGMITASVLCGLATGRIDVVANGALEGAAAAVQLCLSMIGVMCLWMGVMEIMRRCGLAAALARLLRPVLRRLFPDFAGEGEVMDAVSANLSANLLGLGNAASIQLLPTTVASIRAAAGSAAPFDILPAVWLASGISVTTGVLAVKILGRVWPR